MERTISASKDRLKDTSVAEKTDRRCTIKEFLMKRECANGEPDQIEKGWWDELNHR